MRHNTFLFSSRELKAKSGLIYLQERSRPIVFICHSLGGIVAKKVGIL